MRQQLREVAVVGEHQEPLGLVVEATDGEDARRVGHELDDGRASFGIRRGAHVARGLVEEVVDEVVAGGDAHAVDRDHVDLGIDASARLRLLAVHGDATLRHEIVAHATRAVAGAREHLLESFA